MSCPGVQCRSPTFFVLGPHALCVGARHSRARCAGACSSNTLCVMARLSLSQSPALRCSLCRGLVVSVTRPGILSPMSVPAALWGSGAVRPAVFVSGLAFLWPGTLCAGTRRSGPCAFCILQQISCKSSCMHWPTSTYPDNLHMGSIKKLWA